MPALGGADDPGCAAVSAAMAAGTSAQDVHSAAVTRSARRVDERTSLAAAITLELTTRLR